MWRRDRNKKKTKKKPGLSLQSIVSWNVVKCTGAKLISNIIVPVTLGYTSDEFGFGVFRSSVLKKALVESLKTVDFCRLIIIVIYKGKPPHDIAFDIISYIIIES